MVDMQNVDDRLSTIGKKLADCLDARTGDRVSIGADRICAMECSGDSSLFLRTVYAASPGGNYIQVRCMKCAQRTGLSHSYTSYAIF